MIRYDRFSPFAFLRLRGSVAPLALRWAVPCACLATLYRVAIHFLYDGEALSSDPISTISMAETSAWTVFTSILGFLIVFRAQLAYQRYWEGLSLAERACGAWLNSFSSVIAFCSNAPEKRSAVLRFQLILSRMMSLLLCISMCEVSELDHTHFMHLDLNSVDLDPQSLAHLDAIDDPTAKQKVVLQWIQRLIVDHSRNGVLDIAPPILTRAFQELTIGHTHFIDANKVTAVPFPFAFAQMVWLMLVFFSLVVVPGICAFCLSADKAAFYTFIILFPYWSIHFIAVEIEMPFGGDPNDLPLEEINSRFNETLVVLLHPGAQKTPMSEPAPAPAAAPRRSSSAAISAKLPQEELPCQASHSAPLAEVQPEVMESHSPKQTWAYQHSPRRSTFTRTSSRATTLQSDAGQSPSVWSAPLRWLGLRRASPRVGTAPEFDALQTGAAPPQ